MDGWMDGWIEESGPSNRERYSPVDISLGHLSVDQRIMGLFLQFLTVGLWDPPKSAQSPPSRAGFLEHRPGRGLVAELGRLQG